jgi:capsular polysaccharide transport system permease protein
MSRKMTVTFRQALERAGNVMRAVILRDMRTRFFNHGLGFLLVIFWPLAHLFLLLTIYSLLGRRAPYGESLYTFFVSGLVPTLSFMYVSRQMATSLVANRPMLSFPVVHVTDVIFARALLEILGSFMMAMAVVLLLFLIGENVVPVDLPNAVAALCATMFLAVGVGSLVSLLAVALPATLLFYFLIVLVVYLLSGTLFVPAHLPERIIGILSWNPVMHGVEWMRSAYFIGYPTQVLDKDYLLSFAAISLLAGLGLERALRPVFKSK